MSRGRTSIFLCVTAMLAAFGAARAHAQDYRDWFDPPNDAVPRRTDAGNDGLINPATNLPDITRARLGGWAPVNAYADPYTGSWADQNNAQLFRIDVTLLGLINPPGPINLSGFNHDPHRYGPSPVFGYIEFDIDNERNTGGELNGATARYLANVARFAELPESSILHRVAFSGTGHDYDGVYETAPQFERSGTDFELQFCGCFNTTVLSGDDNQNNTFDPGETWLVRGRWFQRATGYQDVSAVFGGSDFGLYDPVSTIRFAHSVESDTTTISLVFPLTMLGAAQLTGQPQQPIDRTIDLGGNHAAVVEALDDLIEGAEDADYGPVYDLAYQWEGEDPFDHLRARQWRLAAILGTAYEDVQENARYIWTDVAFDQTRGDFNGDSVVNALDADLLSDFIVEHDASPDDADGMVNGSVTIINFAPNFSPYDLNYDGVVNHADRRLLGVGCPADWNADGFVNAADVGYFLTDYFADLTNATLHADFDFNGITNTADVGAFLTAYFKSVGPCI